MAGELEPKRWKKLREDLEVPSKLSEIEKEKITAVFERAQQLLNENLEIILGLERDEAYRYTDLILQSLMTADTNFIAGVEAPSFVEKEVTALEPIIGSPQTSEPPKDLELGPKPDIHEILEDLTVGERGKAKHLLDCVKSALKLYEDGDPRYNDPLCYGPDRICNANEMRKCIRTEDPTLEDDMDTDLKAARR